MSFQTCNASDHLWNTNEDVFDDIWELSDPPIDSKGQEKYQDDRRVQRHHAGSGPRACAMYNVPCTCHMYAMSWTHVHKRNSRDENV